MELLTNKVKKDIINFLKKDVDVSSYMGNSDEKERMEIEFMIYGKTKYYISKLPTFINNEVKYFEELMTYCSDKNDFVMAKIFQKIHIFYNIFLEVENKPKTKQKKIIKIKS